MSSRFLRNVLEPPALIDYFLAHPPEDFKIRGGAPLPVFSASFNLLTTADDGLKRRIRRLPGYTWWSSRLSVPTTFAGTTVSEYTLLPFDSDASSLARYLRLGLGRERPLTIVKDLPTNSPLLSQSDNAYAEAFMQACLREGFMMVDGQALAYVPIDFKDGEAYLDRLPKSDRRYLRRKLRTRDDIAVNIIPTGQAFEDDALVDRYYTLYQDVYAQSDIHFDRLTRPFFASILRDGSTGGVVFEYRYRKTGSLLGWNLCFDDGERLIDKYIGFAYPESRLMNLYFVSWMVNLEYALAHGLKHYIAGWTDPAVKALLGAQFTATRHAVYVRNPLLRMVARKFAYHFAVDKPWIDGHGSAS
ncbi:GNAT family N-acetyltransferase [Bordetella sp. N]|uniref:GNAT family N-acetyltransferase n=1 Tax=Bordetella sp. N TaxID=1746199 RepID=UPI00070BCECA|nr:GNAT family N-acetyltransferase [Bordetella sp. N]ALM87150.1 ATP synthase subunit alpha [Bordetella sp. N]